MISLSSGLLESYDSWGTLAWYLQCTVLEYSCRETYDVSKASTDPCCRQSLGGNSLTQLSAGQDLIIQDKGADRMLMTAIDLDIEAEVPHFRSQKYSLGLVNLMTPCWRHTWIHSH